jgi:hypothetical protein
MAADGVDILMSGHEPRERRVARSHGMVIPAVALLVGLVVGSIAGYFIGHSGGPSDSRPPTAGRAQPAGAALGSASAVTPTGERCSAQHGRMLELGVQVLDTADTPVVLHRVTAYMPSRGLRAAGGGWDTCGAIGPVPPPPTLKVLPGATAWATVRVRVLVGCPMPYPVELRLRYSQRGARHTTTIREFPDLSHVGYTGCITLH